MNLYLLMHQDEVWIDRNLVEHKIAEMEPRYASNVVGFLIRQGAELVRRVDFESYFIPWPSEGTSAYDEVEADMVAESTRMNRDPLSWLLSTPLISALIARGKERSA